MSQKITPTQILVMAIVFIAAGIGVWYKVVSLAEQRPIIRYPTGSGENISYTTKFNSSLIKKVYITGQSVIDQQKKQLVTPAQIIDTKEFIQITSQGSLAPGDTNAVHVEYLSKRDINEPYTKEWRLPSELPKP